MIFLFTGLPRASKSLSAIQFTHERFVEEEGREVYAFGIAGLNTDILKGWHDVTDADRIKEWWKFPKKSVILIDEAQVLMPQRAVGRPPEWIERLAMHAHADKFAPDSGAYDFVIITQDGMFIDVFVRRLVNDFRHNVRPVGLNYANVSRYQSVGDPNDYHFQKTAIENYRFKFKSAKRYFNAYKSTDVHTVRAQWPVKKLALVGLASAVVGGSGWYLYSLKTKAETGGLNATKDGKSNNKTANSNLLSGSIIPARLDSGAAVDRPKHSDLVSFVPRVTGLPHTAPRYDEVTTPTKAPVPLACIEKKGKDADCVCFTQQATRMEVEKWFCRKVVKDGYFLDFEPDGRNSGGGSQARNGGGVPGVGGVRGGASDSFGGIVSNGVDRPAVGLSSASGGSSFGGSSIASGSGSGGEPGIRKPTGIREPGY